MKINIEINDALFEKAQKLSGIKDQDILIEKVLKLFVTIESQRKLMHLRGKIELDNEAFQ